MPLDLEEEQEEKNKVNDGIEKGSHYRSTSMSSMDLQDMLHAYATSEDAADLASFQDLLFETVIQERTTPLTAGIGYLENAKISTSKYSQNQLYNIWQLSHVNAMFLANDHLTYLDRRPYDTGFAIDGIKDEDSFQKYIEQHGMTIAAFTYKALTTWYENNPGFYQITQTYPDDSQEAREIWRQTPTFYRTSELPITEKKEAIKNSDKAQKYKKMHAIHIGLAIGKKLNYVCYHSKPGAFKWVGKREKESKADIEQAVRHMKTQTPDLTCRPEVNFALYFCTTHHQFKALFADALNKHKKGVHAEHPMKKTYTSTHIIPVNDSGTFLLWCLMETSPIETEARISKILTEQDAGFDYSPNIYFPLTYKGKRVFLGHTMDVIKIHYALENHLDGGDFYVCCFPEQVSWYKTLFPEKTFL